MKKTMIRATASKRQQIVPAAEKARRDSVRAHFVMDLVALATGVPAEQIASRTRSHARAARARQLSMYLANVAWSWPAVRVGRAFGRDRSTARHACQLIEDLREDRQFDVRINVLEDCLKNAPEPCDVKLLGTDLREMMT